MNLRLAALFFVASLGTAVTGAERPNVIVIMVDDLGYSDIGCYGGEIDTPHLDALAEQGVRFSQFYNTAKCHSSRVSLLTGQYCIAAGDTALSHGVTSAEVLGGGGYFTAMTGKWHLKQQPTDFGFDRYFGHLSGACNYFSGDNTFRLNGERWVVPASDFYTTVADVDYALRFLDEARETEKPWYLYVAFNAPHAPLHALPADYAKYEGRYEEGWDEMRAARVQKQKDVGILPESLKPSPRPEHLPAWSSLPEWRRKYESNRMTTLAAMIDRVDQEIGRLLEDLRKNDEWDNTLILFVSDNGACPYDRRQPRLDVKPVNAETALADSTGWAWARNSPFRYYKQNQFEGGISTPAIVHWPQGIKIDSGSIVNEPAHLIDVLPTLAEVTKSEIPITHPDRDLRPISGVSLKPIFDGKALPPREPIHLLFASDRGLRDGDWKLVSFKGQAWELYNVANDRTELQNLATAEPERLQAMIKTWKRMAHDVLHSPRNAESAIQPTVLPHANREWTKFDPNPPPRGGSPRKVRAIRARKNTKLTWKLGNMELEFSGDDPGIAMDLRNAKLARGPYLLTFRLSTKIRGTGDVFFTTNSQQILPKGERVTFKVDGSDEWQEIRIELPTSKSLKQLRIDVADGPGKASLSDLKLNDANGTVLKQWSAPKR